MPFVVFDVNGRIKDVGSNGPPGQTGATGTPGAALFELAEDGEDGQTSVFQRSPQSINTILQVIQTTVQSIVVLSSGNAGTWVSSGLSISITPKSTTSKILLRADISALLSYSGSGNFPQLGIRIQNVSAATTVVEFDNAAVTQDGNLTLMVPVEILDSPAVITSITYRVDVQLFTTPTGGSSISICAIGTGNRGISVFTAEEFGPVTV